VEKSVEESEERMRLATDGAGVGIWELAVPSGRITYSQRCYEILGLPFRDEAEVLNDFVLARIHPDDLEGVKNVLERSIREHCEYHAEYRVIGVAGEIHWVHSSGKPCLDDSGEVKKPQGVLSDITDRKQVESILAVAATKNERIAEILQRSMLLVSPEGKFPGLEIETLYSAALEEAEVGGDFFDAFDLGHEMIALVVGDVSGKGIVAAGRSSDVKFALRAYLHLNIHPRTALTHLNNFICSTHRSDPDCNEAFIALSLVIVNTSTGATVFAGAGMEPSLILRSNGTTERVQVNGTALGIQVGSRYATKARMLSVGDTILMATDGLTEARHGNEFLGLDGVATLAEHAGPSATLPGLSKIIYWGAKEFADGRLRDDVCLLLARRQSR